MKTKRTTHDYVYRVIDKMRHLDGYLAKVIRRDAHLHKFFQTANHGNDRKRCLRAAVRAARAFAREHPRLTRQEVAELPRAKKDTDLPVGVRRVRHKIKTRVYDFYEAEWSPRPNHQKKKRFSVNLYGEAEAMHLALQARAEGVSAMKG
jgi:hypothetical protein